MEDFRVKLKKPGKIQNFDDSDLSDYLGSTESSSPRVSPPAVKSQAILPKSVPNHLLLVSILEQLCHMYSKDSKQAQDIFYTICNQLSKANVVSPLLILDEMSSLRTQYRLSVHKMLIAAIHKSNKGLSLQLPGSKTNGFPAITYSMSKEPTNNPEDLVNQTSRYKTEFVEVDRIGRGGFGSVFKSRNKLDGNIYAVKKVKFKHSKPEVWYKVLREVKALAFLHHYNVVGYNAAWLEYEPIKLLKPDVVLKSTVEERTDSQSLDSIIFQDSQNGYLDYHPRLNTPSGPKIREITSDVSESSSSMSIVTESKSVKLVRNNSTTDIVKFSQRKSVFETEFQTDFVSSKYSESNSTFSTAFNRNIHKDTIVSTTPKVEFSLNTDSTEVEDFSSSRRYGRSISCDLHATGEAQVTLPAGKQEFVESAFAIQQSVTLYIQMELCDLSLKEWLQKRNDSCTTQDDFLSYVEKNMIIFRQILKGVDFIHSQGVIHRDIKPRNIFLIESDVGMHVKIGDFGLATDEVVTSPITEEPNLPRVTSAGKLTRSASSVSDHTSGVGTSTYAAPEQLQGSLYNTKSDIYSLGVVLYELFMHFRTESERIRSLDDLRKGIIEDKIFEYWPAQAHCIQQMTNHKAELRPSIKDLLHGELFLSKDQIIEDLKAKTESQQKEIERLRRLLADRDRTIDELTKSIPFQDSHLTDLIYEMDNLDNFFLKWQELKLDVTKDDQVDDYETRFFVQQLAPCFDVSSTKS